MSTERISTKLNYPSKFVDVYNSKMHYIEAGEGNPILFLHGIPTSCYIWRNIIPHLAPLGRCIAPDLIGFGHSDKPDIEYSIFDHIKYIDKFIETLELKNITLVMHGWGSIIGFDYAMKHEKNCVALAFYEAFLRSYDEEFSLPYQEQLISMREKIDMKALVDNAEPFINTIISQSVMRELSEEEMNYYLKPFKTRGTGKPIEKYLKELPKGDGKGKIEELINNYTSKLTKSNLPKLMLYSVPGFITTIATAMWAKENLPNLEIVDIGEEFHLAQESYPGLIGENISIWLQSVEQESQHV